MLLDEIPMSLKESLHYYRKYALYQMIIYSELEEKKQCIYIGQEMKKSCRENCVADNFIMYYYYLAQSKRQRNKNLSLNATLLKKQKDYSDYRLLFRLMKRETDDSDIYEQLNGLLYDYVMV